MKKVLLLLLCVCFLMGCSPGKADVDRAMNLRSRLQGSNGCAFSCLITADYLKQSYEFGMDCTFDAAGAMTFSVTQPKVISGITGKILNDTGHLSFDGKILAFELLADGEISPVSAPWLLVSALRGGYIEACGTGESGLQICIRDTFYQEPLDVTVYTDAEDLPCYGEFIWHNRRILSIVVTNFRFL